MIVFEWVLILLGLAIVLSGVARKLGAPLPALLAVGGGLIALLPHAPRIGIDPTLVLALFVAPILLDAAYDTSVRDLRNNWVPLVGLVIFAVVITIVSVAALTHGLHPELPLAAAVTLGAVVAPPDAAAAVSVLREVKLPHRLLVILEGEGLLNDAMALLVYRIAVEQALGAPHSIVTRVPIFLGVIAGSVVFALVCGRLAPYVIRLGTEPATSVVLQLVVTFTMWIVAERLHLSGVLVVVIHAFVIARKTRMPARLRVPSYAVWDTVVFGLNALAFVLIGLQVRPLVEKLSAAQRWADLGFAAAVLGVVVASRFAWVAFFNAFVRWRNIGPAGTPSDSFKPTARGGVIVAWCGMRGIVTVATALALPDDFPGRDLIELTAFAVVLGTLVLQGLTLRPLVTRMRLEDDHTVEREVQHGWERAIHAALSAIDGDDSVEAAALRAEYEKARETNRATGDQDLSAPPLPGDTLRRRVADASRGAIYAMRDSGEIGDDAFHAIERQLDLIELSADRT